MLNERNIHAKRVMDLVPEMRSAIRHGECSDPGSPLLCLLSFLHQEKSLFSPCLLFIAFLIMCVLSLLSMI
jgi:hypothetical protein